MNNPSAFEAAFREHQSGKLQQAETLYRQVLAEHPNHADALHLLGVIAYQSGRHEQSAELIQRAIVFNARTAEYHRNLGLTLAALRRFDQAVDSYHRALNLKPTYPKAYHNLAAALQHVGKLNDAIEACKMAVRQQNNYPEAYNTLGALLTAKGEWNHSIIAYRQAIALQPHFPQAYFNLGISFQQLGQLEEAAVAYKKSVEQRPDYTEALTNLGVVLKMAGYLDEGMQAYQKAVDIQPGNTTAHSNLIYLLQFHPDYGPETIFQRQQIFEKQHAEPLKDVIRPHNNDRNPDRRIKIGYVSPDLRHHVVGTNLLPLLREHDHAQFEIFCYASVDKPDAMSQRLRSFADQWREIARLSDQETAELVRQDQIDILVDLTLHMADNRLLLFARKPAPVQVSYLGYCGGTGLKTIDYRISDPHMDPSEEDLKYYSEKTVRLPHSYWCYQRPDPAPQVMPPPVLKNGYITFGCLNNFAKVSPATQQLWAKVLKAVPNSRVLIHSQPGKHLDAVRNRFAAEGVTADRVEFVGKQAFWQYLICYGRIDIALDPFPYGGGITTCDGLWMGVPAVTLSGQTAVGRGGRSILCNIGLGEWVAYTLEDYVRVATDLAGNIDRLKELRYGLRERMLTSPLMDAKQFARHVEIAYREMWRNWCGK
jgi:protein O-GlcNAc transferase